MDGPGEGSSPYLYDDALGVMVEVELAGSLGETGL